MRVLAALRLYNEGAGCVGIALRGCWLRRDLSSRSLAASGLYNEGAGYVRIV